MLGGRPHDPCFDKHPSPVLRRTTHPMEALAVGIDWTPSAQVVNFAVVLLVLKAFRVSSRC